MSVALLGPDDDIVAVVRAAKGESVTVVIATGRDSLALALTRAALAPLAIERAPMRINAVEPATGAAGADVTAAIAFLEGARSITGQLLAVG